MIQIENIELNEITKDVVNGSHFVDVAHEEADSDSRVIYYSQAREYVLNHPNQSELEDEWKDLGLEFTDLDTLFTQLSFIGIKNDLITDYTQELEYDLIKLKEQLIDNQVELDCVESDRFELIECFERWQSDIEDAIEKIEEQV